MEGDERKIETDFEGQEAGAHVLVDFGGSQLARHTMNIRFDLQFGRCRSESGCLA